MAKVKDILNSVRNPFNDPVVKTNTMLSSTIDALSGNNELARTIISDGSVDQPRKARMKGADNDVIESLAKMQIGGFCDFNTKMGEFMERLMRINLNEHNITLDETGFDAHRFGESDSLNYDITKSYSYTKDNNYIEDFVKQVKKDEVNGIDATQKMAADGVYMKTTNMYPDDITGAGSGDFRSYEKWAVKNKNSILYKTKQLFRQKKINTIISKFGTNADGLSNDILYKGSNRTAYGESHGRNLLKKDAENGGGNYNINGYNNPYCRVWTHHYKYDRLNKTIRPLSGEGNISNFHSWRNGFENDDLQRTGDVTHVTDWSDSKNPTLIYNGYSIYRNEKNGKLSYNLAAKDMADYGQNQTVNGPWKGNPHETGWQYSVLDTSKGGDGLLKITPKFSKGNTESNIHTKDCMFSIENLAWKGYDPYSFENALSWEQRGPLGGRIMWFPPYGIEFNESTNVNWSRNTFIGRGEDVYTYVNTQRTGNLSFLMVVDHPSIIDYATWNTNAPQPSETDMLRFFAGCDDGEGSDSLTSYVQPTPLTDEGVHILGPNEKILKKSDEIKDVIENKGKDVEKTNITVKVMAFFPNNYSGSYDDWDYTFGYLLMGRNTWTDYEADYRNGKRVYRDADTFKEVVATAYAWEGDKRIDTERTLIVDFKELLFNGKFEQFENARQIKAQNGNWVTDLQTDGEYQGKPMLYLEGGKSERGYECNIKDGGITRTDETGICKSPDTPPIDVPCSGVIYAYRTTFDKAFNQFIRDKRKNKGVSWYYRVDGVYSDATDVENTYNQRIPDPSGRNIQPNENYKDKTNYKLNLNASSWTEAFGGGNKPSEDNINNPSNSSEEEIIYCSLNDFVAAMDKGLFKSQEVVNNIQSGKNIKVKLPDGTETDTDISSALTTTSNLQTLLKNDNYLYNRSETKDSIKKLWSLFNEGELVSVECKGYSNSHGTATPGSKANNPKLALTRATRLGELIEARFGVKANVGYESAKSVKGFDHNSKEAKLWRSAVATLKFQVATKDDVHSSQSKADEDDLPLLTWEQIEAEIDKDQSKPTTETNGEQGGNGRNLLGRRSGMIKANGSNACIPITSNWMRFTGDVPYGIGSDFGDTNGVRNINNIAKNKVKDGEKATVNESGCAFEKKYSNVWKEFMTIARKPYNKKVATIKIKVLGKHSPTYINILSSTYAYNAVKNSKYGKAIDSYTLNKCKGTFSVKVKSSEAGAISSKEITGQFSGYFNKKKNYYNNLIGTQLYITKESKPIGDACDNKQETTNKNNQANTTNKVENKVNNNVSGGGSGASINHINRTGSGSGGATSESPNNQKPDATPVSNTPNEDENKKLAEMQRKTNEAQWAADQLRRKSAEENYKQEGNKIVEETVLNRITPDYMLRSDREGKRGDKNVLRYDQEYYFFKSLEKKDKIVYDKLMDKIKYFDPAFHSMTPEGFNARLTFLNQCTRQGNTISISDQNTTESGKINKSVKTANNLAFGRPPYCVLRLGDFYNQMIVINNITIDYSVSDGIQWDMNTEGIGMQPLLARVNISFNFIGGSDMAGPVRRLQNAMTFNYYANARYYDNRADRMSYPANTNTLPMGAVEYNVDKENSTAFVAAMTK